MAKSCKGLAMELVKCLSESDCVKVENRPYRECAKEKAPKISSECVGLRETWGTTGLDAEVNVIEHGKEAGGGCGLPRYSASLGLSLIPELVGSRPCLYLGGTLVRSYQYLKGLYMYKMLIRTCRLNKVHQVVPSSVQAWGNLMMAEEDWSE
ncbi:UNVERIFIED_CONTAM: hypothetical protein Scaly_1884900 [Sesamum calycinum]|uniref:Uncharacterized protein n=1 Tax=Sesamum calycinum TaxID=2727403 RepID=A0AAW2NG85_9LAMI